MEAMEQLPQREKRGRRQLEAAQPKAMAADVQGAPGSSERVREQLQQLQLNPSEHQGDDYMMQGPAAASNEQAFEYLDHTADIQIHSWGGTLEDAFASAGLGMYNYMVPLEQLELLTSRDFHAEAHDMESLLFAFLDELLFTFHTEMLVCKQLRVTKLDREHWTITATGHGEAFERSKHEQGTEIKAITYSAMQIYEKQEEGRADIYVIVDI